MCKRNQHTKKKKNRGRPIEKGDEVTYTHSVNCKVQTVICFEKIYQQTAFTKRKMKLEEREVKGVTKQQLNKKEKKFGALKFSP